MRACRSVAALLFAVLLAGCYADLDWRELRVKEGGFSIWLPARASQQARELSGIPGAGEMRQWSARAKETAFAAGYADVDGARLATALEFSDALVGNIGGRVESRRDLELAGLRGI